MSFYGDMAPKGLTFLQFDKIYPTRTAMMEAIDGDKDDGVFVGRFVVVNYYYGSEDEYGRYANRQALDENDDCHAIVYQKILSKEGKSTYLEIIDLKGNIPQVSFNGVDPNTQNEYVKKDEEHSTLASPVFNIKKPWEICPVIGLNQDVEQSGNNNTITIKSVYKDGDAWKVVEDDNINATHKQFIFNIGNLAAADSIVTGMASLFSNSGNLPGLVYAKEGSNNTTSLSIVKIDDNDNDGTLSYNNNTLKVNKITEDNISGTISSDKLATGDTDGAVATSNIRKGAVTNSKLATKANGGTAAVATNNIQNGAVTSVELSSKNTLERDKAAVGTNNIKDGAVTSVELSSKNNGTAAVATNNIQDGAVTNKEIKENTIKYILKNIEIKIPQYDSDIEICKKNITDCIGGNEQLGYEYKWEVVDRIKKEAIEEYNQEESSVDKELYPDQSLYVLDVLKKEFPFEYEENFLNNFCAFCDIKLICIPTQDRENFDIQFFPEIFLTPEISAGGVFIYQVRTFKKIEDGIIIPYLRLYLNIIPEMEKIMIPTIELWREGI